MLLPFPLLLRLLAGGTKAMLTQGVPLHAWLERAQELQRFGAQACCRQRARGIPAPLAHSRCAATHGRQGALRPQQAASQPGGLRLAAPLGHLGQRLYDRARQGAGDTNRVSWAGRCELPRTANNAWHD